ncbi:MAG: hypothetical protein ACI8YQ_002430 [Polaribacter sp.]|jgi:hypothetical protein
MTTLVNWLAKELESGAPLYIKKKKIGQFYKGENGLVYMKNKEDQEEFFIYDFNLEERDQLEIVIPLLPKIKTGALRFTGLLFLFKNSYVDRKSDLRSRINAITSSPLSSSQNNYQKSKTRNKNQ